MRLDIYLLFEGDTMPYLADLAEADSLSIYYLSGLAPTSNNS